MNSDVPSDVAAVLKQLFHEGETAILAGEYETAGRILETVETVSRNKLPNGDLRGQLLHGCHRVEQSLDTSDTVHADAAAEYLRAMARRLDRADR